MVRLVGLIFVRSDEFAEHQPRIQFLSQQVVLVQKQDDSDVGEQFGTTDGPPQLEGIEQSIYTSILGQYLVEG